MNTTQENALSFRAWMRLVDHAIYERCGLSSDDLADQLWSDWWNDEVTPQEAAELALADEGFPFDE